jgi:hypothetical protein
VLHAVVLLHVPFTHCSPILQAAQVAPFVPQNAGSLPPLQVVPEQQPTQFVGVQVVVHACETHVWVPVHATQAAPALPHALVWVPAWQMSPWQHPVGQEVVVQVHLWLEQAWLVPQLLHAAPPVPQAVFAVPVWHLPAESQQPVAQFVAVHPVGAA